MSTAFEHLQQSLKRLPGLGFRSAERIALHLLVERPESAADLLERLQHAQREVKACPVCGNLCEGDVCDICADTTRDRSQLCVLESVTDLRAMERAGAYRGLYHILHGKLSPIHGIGPESLNLKSLRQRLQTESIREIILALPNDMEGEATCHFLREEFFTAPDLTVSRIGFGLPNGGGIPFADAVTLRSALSGRRPLSH